VEYLADAEQPQLLDSSTRSLNESIASFEDQIAIAICSLLRYPLATVLPFQQPSPFLSSGVVRWGLRPTYDGENVSVQQPLSPVPQPSPFCHPEA
jgi:hypothetical protein